MNQEYMKEKSIFPLLLSMSLPMMLSMLVQSLYNIIDSIFVAKLGEDALTAVSLVYPLQNLITALTRCGSKRKDCVFSGSGEKKRGGHGNLAEYSFGNGTRTCDDGSWNPVRTGSPPVVYG